MAPMRSPGRTSDRVQLAMKAEAARGRREAVVEPYDNLPENSTNGSGSNLAARRSRLTGSCSAKTQTTRLRASSEAWRDSAASPSCPIADVTSYAVT
jgi:hypothetical protein